MPGFSTQPERKTSEKGFGQGRLSTVEGLTSFLDVRDRTVKSGWVVVEIH